MARKKFYAVRKGNTTGIFETWEACKAAVVGYPCAEYRGFSTEEEAKGYLCSEEQRKEASPDCVTAYVDGSYEESIGRYSFGCILLLPDGQTVEEFGNGSESASLALRNVAGEMLGAMYAVLWCVKNGYSAVLICYDYAGIEQWATGGWRAKNELTGKYADFMKKNAGRIDISFKKIAAHTGDLYNEEADRLAKRALTQGNGIPEIQLHRV